MTKRLWQGLVLIAGLLLAPGGPGPAGIAVAVPPEPDPRVVRLKQFFTQRESPVHELAEDFLAAADLHQLDWRLLPSISVIESGGGKEYTNNNIFGWDSCRKRFPTVRHGIHLVASRLANSKLYKDKDLDEILETYNPGYDYPAKVKAVMRTIGPARYTPQITSN